MANECWVTKNVLYRVPPCCGILRCWSRENFSSHSHQIVLGPVYGTSSSSSSSSAYYSPLLDIGLSNLSPPSIAFYGIHGRKGDMLFFCSVSDTTRDINLFHKSLFSIFFRSSFLHNDDIYKKYYNAMFIHTAA
jgi:hypothetical protein